MPTEYEKQAADFLSRHGLKFRAVYADHVTDPGFPGSRDRFRCTVSGHGRGRVSFLFTTSIFDTADGSEPTAYDLLACIQKYDCGDFESFCGDFGYDTDSRKAHKVWLAVRDEWRKVSKFFTAVELDELQEIN